MAALLAALAAALPVPTSAAATPWPAPITGTGSAPYMGVDTWYAFDFDIDQRTIVALTNAVVASGLRAAGYRYIWIDAGWWNGTTLTT